MKYATFCSETSSINSVASKISSISSTPSNQNIKELCENVKKLYIADPKKKKLIVSKYYSNLCEFVDPLVKVKGRENLYAQFLALNFFNKVEVEILNIEPVVEVIKKAGDYETPELEFNIINKQSYYKTKNPFVLKTNTKLNLVFENSHWVVLKHKDTWIDHSKFDITPEFLKSLWGSFTSLLITSWFGLK
ncbi:hypothetical protein HDU92_005407 [Lobulomyces angularis]|nr:hypothetical protein HDU92_005407 [Lobulomyces angularis]